MMRPVEVATSAVEKPEDVATAIRSALGFAAQERLLPRTNRGMQRLSCLIAQVKLEALARSTALVHREIAS